MEQFTRVIASEKQNPHFKPRFGGQKLPFLLQRIYGYVLVVMKVFDSPIHQLKKDGFYFPEAMLICGGFQNTGAKPRNVAHSHIAT